MVPLKSNQEEVNTIVIGRVPLTPIQKQFFVGQFNNINHFNQSNVLVPSVKLNHSQVQQAINKLALHHDMLRAIYQSQNNQWIQTVQDPSSFKFPTVVSRRVESHQELEEFVQASQMKLNIESGPLYFCSLIEFGDEQRLFLTIHHLVIDLVSWRIIFEDLELLLKGLELPSKSMSFLKWSELLEKDISANDSWAMHTVPVDNYVQNSALTLTNEYDSKSLTYFLSEEASSKLDKANVAFKTNIQDLILSAMVYSLNSMEGNNSSMRIFMEGHGREPWRDDIDVTRTIGWFTSMYPVVLPVCNEFESQLRSVKQILRTVPDKGISYTPDMKCISENITVSFNYLGKFQGIQSSKGFFSLDSIVSTKEVEDGFVTEQNILVTCFHAEDQLGFSLNCHGSVPIEIIEDWIQKTIVTLEDGVASLHQHDSIIGFTQSDFPLLPVETNMKEIEESLHLNGLQLNQVEDIYPTTALQGGLLYATIRDPSEYTVQQIWEFESLDMARFKQAWNKVVLNYSILRTMFVSTSNGLHQVVLNEDYTKWIELGDVHEEELVEFNEKLMRSNRREGFSLDDRNFTRFVYFRVKVLQTQHHSITDAWSGALIQSSLQRAYDGLSLPDSVPFRDHVEYIVNMDVEEPKQFWKSKLEGFEYQSFPLLTDSLNRTSNKRISRHVSVDMNKMKQLTKDLQITMGTVIHTAWSLLLYNYSRNEKVVFGNVISGRDSGMEGIESIAGILINTIPIIANIRDEMTVKELLLQISAFYVDSLPYNHSSLVDIKKWSKILATRNLFDTALNYYHFPESQDIETNNSLNFNTVSAHEESEYPLSLSISNTINGFAYTFACNSDNHTILRLMITFEDIVQQICETSEKKIQDMTLVTYN
ncbi:hypothetical protein HDV02_005177, partial [Globomyces sp. JEL0801]